MSYANLVLEKESDKTNTVEAPIGFSWVILFSPIVVSLISFLIQVGVVAIFDISDLGNSLLFFIIIVIPIVLILFVLQLFCFVPLSRKDTKWTLIMLLSGIFTFGISTLFFAFTYNKTYISGKYREGYRVLTIMTIENTSSPLADLNPIKYNDKYSQYYIWVNWYRMKIMKYFSDSESATAFVKLYNSCP